jgi:hypothetical protein
MPRPLAGPHAERCLHGRSRAETRGALAGQGAEGGHPQLSQTVEHLLCPRGLGDRRRDFDPRQGRTGLAWGGLALNFAVAFQLEGPASGGADDQGMKAPDSVQPQQAIAQHADRVALFLGSSRRCASGRPGRRAQRSGDPPAGRPRRRGQPLPRMIVRGVAGRAKARIARGP